MAEHIVHWDDVETEYDEAGTIGGTWTALGRAAGSDRIGMNRIRVEPGRRSTPLHSESDEEIFFVLAGGGLSWQREGDEDTTFEIGEGDCLVHLAYKQAHTLVAGDEGLDVLAFGVGPRPSFAYFPRLAAMRFGHAIVDVDGRHQWDMEGALDDPELPPPSPRPSRIVNWRDVEPEQWARGDVSVEIRYVGEAAGSVGTGIRYNRIAPGMLNVPPHCHSVEEELFVVLDGEGTCLLGDDEHPVRHGHVVARPASSRVPHAFRAGPGGMTILGYGTRDPNDIAYYSRSRKIYFRGVGLMTRVERLDYWDGEEDLPSPG
jgi:uncharacterized cupin superfamily protein